MNDGSSFIESANGLHDSEQVFRHQEPIPDANKRYLMILEENARAQMALFSPKHNNSAQRVGKLYGAGMNHPLIGDGVDREILIEESGLKGSPVGNTATSALVASGALPERRGRGEERGGLKKSTISVQHSTATKHQYPSPVQSRHTFSTYPSQEGGGGAAPKCAQPMKTATALGMLDRQAGGKYHVPSHLHEPYSEPLTVSIVYRQHVVWCC
jgi:hypothetical protein